MAKEHVIEGRATSPAAPDAVWALLADTAGWPRWSGVEQARRVADGSPDPEGVGARRLFLTGRVRNEEEVVRFESGRALGYRVVGGNIPVRDYRSQVLLTATGDGGTQIEWRSIFRAKWPGSGALVQKRLGAFIQETTERLAAAAADGPAADA